MKSDTAKVPLVIPSSLRDDEERITDAFRAEGIDVSIVGLYATKAAGPLPDANFWIDLARHAQAFPLEHFIDQLEGAFGVALLSSFDRIRKWAGKKIRIHLRLPTSKQPTHYIIPEEPDAKAAIRAIAKHHRATRNNAANEYFWVDAKWVSADDYFKAKRG